MAQEQESQSIASTSSKPQGKGEVGATLKRIFSMRMFICVVLGFSSGLPLYLLFNLVMAWLRDANVDLKDIGLFSLVTVPYIWKFLWAPFLDRYNVLRCGRRRSWMLLTQLGLTVLIAGLGFFTPGETFKFAVFGSSYELANLTLVMGLCTLIAFLSATQDVALDAYRREILADEELGLGNAYFVNAYRISGMIPGGLSLILSEYISWHFVFPITAFFMLPGILASIFIKEPACCAVPRTLLESVYLPFVEFIKRKGVLGAIGVISFIFLYKLGDSMATALATPFYMDMGYSKSSIGIINKTAGLWTMVIGGFAGGILMLKIGINRALWIFGVGQIITILGYVFIAHAWKHPDFVATLLTQVGNLGGILVENPLFSGAGFEFPSKTLLAIVVGAESLGAGLGTACFVAYMCRETSHQFVATQLAIFTALSAIPRTVCNASTGYIVEWLGWEHFFIFCYALAIPGMVMLIYVAPWKDNFVKPN